MTFAVAEITIKVAVITSSVAKITFVGAVITFKVAVITSAVAKITFVVAEMTLKALCSLFHWSRSICSGLDNFISD